MSKKFLFLISFVLVLSLAYTSYGDYDPCTGVVGNWEDVNDGWDIWPNSAGFVTAEYNDVTGVTLGSKSLKLTVLDGGWQTIWRLRFQNDPNLLKAFFDNDTFWIDVTRLAAEWQPPGQYSGVQLVVNAGSGLGGIWDDLGGQLWWSPGDGDAPRTASWSYGYLHDGVNDGNDSNNPEIDPCDVNYVEFIIVTNFDDANYPQGTYYLDRARLTYLGGQQEPIGWWKLNDGDGNVATDSSGNGFDANLYGDPTWVTSGGPYDDSGYLDFDGTNDWADANYLASGDINLSGLYTVAAWFRSDGGAGNRDIFCAVNPPGHGIMIELRPTDSPPGRIRYVHRSPVQDTGVYEENIYSTTGGYGDGRWHHVAAVRESSNSRKLYVDGTEVGSNTNASQGFDKLLIPVFGVLRPDSLTRFWNGGLDDIRLYNRPLSPAEILELVVTLKAGLPKPGDGTADVSRTPTLSWMPGKYAADVNGHRVYFNDVRDNVKNRNGCDVNGVVTTDPCYPISTPLSVGTTYYWAIDEVNDPCMWPGNVWSFTTLLYSSVDNFESYADSAALRLVWKKLSTKAIVSVATDANYVHSGGQSMQYRYDNYTSPYYSEAYADAPNLPCGSDWSTAKLLTLYFYGLAANDANEQMYVKLTDGGSPAKTAKVIYDGDANDVKEEEWHEWNIPLAAFTGVNLANVKKIAIGFGDGIVPGYSWGGSYVYFDDIRLYLPRCVLSARSEAFAKADYDPFSYLGSGDCEIDYQELEIMANTWLAEDDVIAPTTDPNIAGGLVAYYPMNEGSGTVINDANGNPSHQGTFSAAGVSWATPGVIIDGNGTSGVYVNGQSGSRISLGTWNPAHPDTNELTLSIWAKWIGPTGFSQGLISKRDGWGSSDTLMFMFEITSYGDSMLALRQFGDAATDVTSGAITMMDYIGRWTHLATTFDGNTATLYINGVNVASGPFFFGGNPDAGMTIGNSQSAVAWDASPEAFNGELDEARIYNRALSAAEIAYLADTTPGDGQQHVPVPSYAELYEGEAEGSRSVNFRDFAYLANMWLEEQLWPR